MALAMLLVGCERKSSNEVDSGSVKNSVYHNDYFGFSVTIPTNWSMQDLQAQRQLTRRGESMVAGDDKNMKAALKASELQSLNLFGAFKYPIGSPVTNNPAIMCVAENVQQLPGIIHGKDYLFHVKQLLQSGQVVASFPTNIYSERLNGVDFDVLDVNLSIGPRTVKEKYYTTIRKGYALSLVFVEGSDDAEPFDRQVLDTIVFK